MNTYSCRLTRQSKHMHELFVKMFNYYSGFDIKFHEFFKRKEMNI